LKIYKLENTVKHYVWGSPEWIPGLLGREVSGEPWAELWMGVHPEGPSQTTVNGKRRPLSELADLPFLLKFLAAGSPLSIQAHPDSSQAREGFERENRAGIALSAPERNYKDPNHKPEILCALSPFTAMAGFREEAEAEELLKLLRGTEKLREALRGGYGEFLSLLFGSGEDEKKALNRAALEAESGGNRALALCGEFARSYPADPGILSPLYLNVIELEPRQGIFVPAGILHAYVRGFAVECMAASDNVLRGGLTPKHVDIKELFRILRFEPFKPAILNPLPGPGYYSYQKSCGEFSLFLCRGPAAELEAGGDAIIAVTEGRAELEGGSLKQGESAFIPRRSAGEKISFRGDFTLFAALVP
jgi:mannose-6-phosphate isomerase